MLLLPSCGRVAVVVQSLSQIKLPVGMDQTDAPWSSIHSNSSVVISSQAEAAESPPQRSVALGSPTQGVVQPALLKFPPSLPVSALGRHGAWTNNELQLALRLAVAANPCMAQEPMQDPAQTARDSMKGSMRSAACLCCDLGAAPGPLLPTLASIALTCKAVGASLCPKHCVACCIVLVRKPCLPAAQLVRHPVPGYGLGGTFHAAGVQMLPKLAARIVDYFLVCRHRRGVGLASTQHGRPHVWALPRGGEGGAEDVFEPLRAKPAARDTL